jgi:hypothetical protein
MVELKLVLIQLNPSLQILQKVVIFGWQLALGIKPYLMKHMFFST